MSIIIVYSFFNTTLSQVWFQNARAKFRRNSIQCREASNNLTHAPSLPSTSFHEPVYIFLIIENL